MAWGEREGEGKSEVERRSEEPFSGESGEHGEGTREGKRGEGDHGDGTSSSSLSSSSVATTKGRRRLKASPTASPTASSTPCGQRNMVWYLIWGWCAFMLPLVGLVSVAGRMSLNEVFVKLYHSIFDPLTWQTTLAEFALSDVVVSDIFFMLI